MEDERLEQFLRDASGFCESLRQAFAKLEAQPDDRDLVHQAFRYAHSLKSEAQFLKLEELGAVAHEMEGVLEQIRQGSLAVGKESLGILLPMVDAFEEMMPSIEPTGLDASTTVAASSGLTTGSGPARAPAVAGTGIPRFTEFERQLIDEARARGERLYRISCEIEDSAPLKYPKAYLVLNNLELLTNVIRSVPSFETKEDEAFQFFDVFFTSTRSEESVRDAVDVDQVSVLSISEIAFKRLEQAGEVRPQSTRHASPLRGPSSVRVENGRLDDLNRRLRALRSSVEQLRRRREQDPDRMDADLAELAGEIAPLERLVIETRQVPFSEEFRHVPWLVQDLAARLGKRVQLVVTGENVRIDRRLLSMLSEPLIHLVRNAVDHGIEAVDERAAAGKDPVGTITISAVARGSEVVLQVGDDGRGISSSTVEARAKELGFLSEGAAGDEGILGLLVRPGFSTRSEPTDVSGRGVGLDVIHQKVHEALGGDLRLETQEGQGTLFTISVPGGASMMSMLMARGGKHTVGIPLRDVGEMLDVEARKLRPDGEGVLCFEGVRVRTVDGFSTREDLRSDSYVLVLLRTGTGRVPFLCDELLFERDVPEDRLSADESASHGLRAVRIGETTADFLLLDSSALE